MEDESSYLARKLLGRLMEALVAPKQEGNRRDALAVAVFNAAKHLGPSWSAPLEDTDLLYRALDSMAMEHLADMALTGEVDWIQHRLQDPPVMVVVCTHEETIRFLDDVSDQLSGASEEEGEGFPPNRPDEEKKFDVN